MNIQEAKAVRTNDQQAGIDQMYSELERGETFILMNNDQESRLAAFEFRIVNDPEENGDVVKVDFMRSDRTPMGIATFTCFDQVEIFLQHNIGRGYLSAGAVK